MALPILSQTNVQAVQLTRASTFPGIEPLTINQIVGVSDDNTIRVFSLGPPKKTLEVVFAQLSRQDITDVLAFFNNPLVNWGLFPFFYIDEESVSHTVRLLQPEFSPVEVSDDNINLTLVFTEV